MKITNKQTNKKTNNETILCNLPLGKRSAWPPTQPRQRLHTTWQQRFHSSTPKQRQQCPFWDPKQKETLQQPGTSRRLVNLHLQRKFRQTWSFEAARLCQNYRSRTALDWPKLYAVTSHVWGELDAIPIQLGPFRDSAPDKLRLHTFPEWPSNQDWVRWRCPRSSWWLLGFVILVISGWDSLARVQSFWNSQTQ